MAMLVGCTYHCTLVRGPEHHPPALPGGGEDACFGRVPCQRLHRMVVAEDQNLGVRVHLRGLGEGSEGVRRGVRGGSE
eukprot:9480337-Pyramimonas_sp.AAC.2